MGMANRIIADALPMIARACGVELANAASSVESITTDNPRAYLHYMAGLLAKEEGRGKDAMAEIEKAVALDTAFALAYYELSRLTNVFIPNGWRRAVDHAEKAAGLQSRLGTRDRMPK